MNSIRPSPTTILRPAIFILFILLVRQTLSQENSTLEPDPAPNLPKYEAPLIYANFSQCQAEIQKESLPFKPQPVDRNGNLLKNTTITDSAVKGVDYDTCLAYCGPGSPKPSWSFFSTQFSAWVLPFFALTAQFPYETGQTGQNIMSFFLIVGSPMFAMYSLSLTFLNSRWLRSETKRVFEERESGINEAGRMIPGNKFKKLKGLPENLEGTLRYCQQEPLYLGDLRTGLREDTIQYHVEYWNALWERVKEAKRPYTASFVHQLAWVVIAFVVTIIDAFDNENLGKNETAFGLSIGLLWIWELPIVFGWVVAGTLWREEAPRDMIRRLKKIWESDSESEMLPIAECEHGHDIVRQDPQADPDQVKSPNLGTATSEKPVQQSKRPATGWPLEQEPPDVEESRRNTILWASAKHDLHRRGPVFGYSRPFTWSYTSLTLLTAYARVFDPNQSPNNQWANQVKKRIVLASVLGLILLWSTVGAAMVLNYNTPAKGLSCRSGGNLIYLLNSIAVWALLVTAAWITDKPATHYLLPPQNTEPPSTPNPPQSSPLLGLNISKTYSSPKHSGNLSPLVPASHYLDPNQGPNQSSFSANSSAITSHRHSNSSDHDSQSGLPFFTPAPPPTPSESDLTLHGLCPHPLSPRAQIHTLAMLLRTLGKTIAILNALWAVTHNFLEFLSVLDNCWCSTTQVLRGRPGVTHAWLWEGLADIRGYEDVERTWQLVTAWSCVVCGGGMWLIWGVCRGFKRRGGE